MLRLCPPVVVMATLHHRFHGEGECQWRDVRKITASHTHAMSPNPTKPSAFCHVQRDSDECWLIDKHFLIWGCVQGKRTELSYSISHTPLLSSCTTGAKLLSRGSPQHILCYRAGQWFFDLRYSKQRWIQKSYLVFGLVNRSNVKSFVSRHPSVLFVESVVTDFMQRRFKACLTCHGGPR